MRAATLLILLMVSFVIAACRVDPDSIITLDEKLSVEIYNAGREITRKEITANDKAYLELVKWLRTNTRGWTPSLVTYAPRIKVRGAKFNINFHQTSAILNFQSPYGNYLQYVKDNIKETEYQFLLK